MTYLLLLVIIAVLVAVLIFEYTAHKRTKLRMFYQEERANEFLELLYPGNRRNILNFDQYQRLASTTLNNDLTERKKIVESAFGMMGELGEVIDCIKKHLYQGHDLDAEEIKKELGDLLWYMTYLATIADLTMNEVAVANITKLKERYPNGFSYERSINRKEGKK